MSYGTELTLKTSIGDENCIWIDGVGERVRIQVNVGRDQKRVLVNGHGAATVSSVGTLSLDCHSLDPENDKEIVRLSAEVACLKRNLRHDAEIVQNLHERMTNRHI